MPPTGHLFGINGAQLAVIPKNGCVKIKDKEFGTEVAGKHLYLTYRDDSEMKKSHQSALSNISNELQRRQRYLVLVEADIKKISTKLEKGDDNADELGLDLARLMGIKGKHRKRIKELTSMTTIQVPYKGNAPLCRWRLVGS